MHVLDRLHWGLNLLRTCIMYCKFERLSENHTNSCSSITPSNHTFEEKIYKQQKWSCKIKLLFLHSLSRTWSWKLKDQVLLHQIVSIKQLFSGSSDGYGRKSNSNFVSSNLDEDNIDPTCEAIFPSTRNETRLFRYLECKLILKCFAINVDEERANADDAQTRGTFERGFAFHHRTYISRASNQSFSSLCLCLIEMTSW